MGTKMQVAVVGGGMMGIAAALELARCPDAEVTVIEKNPYLGGLSAPYSWNGVTWDRFYHVILSTDAHLLEFVSRIGLENELFWTDTKSGFFDQGKLVSMSSIGDFLRFPFLSMWQKLRLGIGIVLGTRRSDLSKLDRMYARQWLTRLFGRRVFEKIWDPLLRSKLGSARERTSAAFMWATINRLYGARRGRERVERMGHVRGGYATILDRARERLQAAGVRLLLGQAVTHVGTQGAAQAGQIAVHTSENELRFDRALMTIPAPEILRLTVHDPHIYWDSLAKVSYLGVICVLLVLKRSLSPYYVINLLDRSLPFTGVIEATNVVPCADVGGTHLLYLPKYVVADDPLWAAADGEVVQLFLRGLQRVFPELAADEVLHTAVFREPWVQPMQEVGSLGRSVGFATPIDRLYVANTSMIYNSTLNNNAVVALAARAARELAGCREEGGER